MIMIFEMFWTATLFIIILEASIFAILIHLYIASRIYKKVNEKLENRKALKRKETKTWDNLKSPSR